MAPKHKEVLKDSPRKKAKGAKAGSQSGLGGFLKTVTPASDPTKEAGKRSNGTTDKGVISIASDSEAEEHDSDVLEQVQAPVASTSTIPLDSKQVRPVANEIIDLADILSDSDGEEDIKPLSSPFKPVNGSNAAVHPLFRKTVVKSEVDGNTDTDTIDAALSAVSGECKEDLKPIVHGKGKAESTNANSSGSPKKLIFPTTNVDEPIVYPLEKDIFEFDPKQDIATGTWPRTQAGKLHTPYSFLVAAFVAISATRSRLIIVTVLTNTLRTIVEFDPDALKDTVYLVSTDRCSSLHYGEH